MTRQTRAEAVQGERRRRRSATLDGSEELRLALPEQYRDDKAFTYRWVNDDGNRVNSLYQKDWDVVQPTRTNEGATENETRRYAGTKADGTPLHAVLMRKPIEFHKEDRLAKDKQTEDREDALLESPVVNPEDPQSSSPDTTYIVKGSRISRRGNYAP